MKSKIILGMLAGVCASAVSAQNQYGALNFWEMISTERHVLSVWEEP